MRKLSQAIPGHLYLKFHISDNRQSSYYEKFSSYETLIFQVESLIFKARKLKRASGIPPLHFRVENTETHQKFNDLLKNQ